METRRRRTLAEGERSDLSSVIDIVELPDESTPLLPPVIARSPTFFLFRSDGYTDRFYSMVAVLSYMYIGLSIFLGLDCRRKLIGICILGVSNLPFLSLVVYTMDLSWYDRVIAPLDCISRPREHWMGVMGFLLEFGAGYFLSWLVGIRSISALICRTFGTLLVFSLCRVLKPTYDYGAQVIVSGYTTSLLWDRELSVPIIVRVLSCMILIWIGCSMVYYMESEGTRRAAARRAAGKNDDI